MKIIVLAGGLSPERDVSLSSACLIANSLVRSGHSAALVDLCFDLPDDLHALYSDHADFSYQIPPYEPDLEEIRVRSGRRTGFIGKNVLRACAEADAVFIALHGSIGEDGRLQAALEAHGIRHTGSDYLGCALAMNKDLSKQLLRGAGIPTAPWKTCSAADCTAAQIEAEVGLPCVIKPCSCGSSVGVSIVRSADELRDALSLAARYETCIIAERYVAGREFSIGVLEGKALAPVEIIPNSGFYDYVNKYQSGCTTEICPAPLSEEENRQLAALALAVHQTLRLGSYSRADFILDERTHQFVCLEANALPGMTPTSLLPQGAAACGIDFDALCLRILRASLKPHNIQ